MTDSESTDGLPSTAESKPVPVVETSTAEEAFMLEQALRKEGIYAAVVDRPDPGPLIGFVSPNPQFMSAKRTFFVASKDAVRAEGVIQRFVQESRRKAICNAFDPRFLEELLNDIKAPADLLEMEELQTIDPEVRREKLAQRIAEWLSDDMDEVMIAQRLAASGLSLQEARLLMKEVVLEEQHRLKQAREDRLQTARSFMGVGIAFFVVAGMVAVFMLVTQRRSFLIDGLAGWSIIIGAALCCWGTVVKSRAAPVEERELTLLADDAPGAGVVQEDVAK